MIMVVYHMVGVHNQEVESCEQWNCMSETIKEILLLNRSTFLAKIFLHFGLRKLLSYYDNPLFIIVIRKSLKALPLQN